MDHHENTTPAELAKRTIRLANGMVGKEFSARIDFRAAGTEVQDAGDPDLSQQLDAIGLSSTLHEGVLVLSGIPSREGEHEFRFQTQSGDVAISWFVNADPRSLWKNLEPDPSLGYRKDHTATLRLQGKHFEVVGGSRRGRAHAHEGKFREDDFAVAEVGDWLVAAVADGAGSARFSREGSRLACQRAIESLTDSVPKLFDEPFVQAVYACAGGDESAQKHVRNVLYQVLCGAAFDAYKTIEHLSSSASHPIKDYATTLLLTACHRFEQRTFVGSFWIGDGAIAVLQDSGVKATLMGHPDAGEFSGQTRFLTMSDILADPHAMLRRVELALVNDVTAVVLMTDGVSDPKFGTDNRLLSSEAWAELWSEVDACVGTSVGEDAERRLLEWMDFWSAGEHDDRTLLVIRPQART